jgi:hypothetical protein
MASQFRNNSFILLFLLPMNQPWWAWGALFLLLDIANPLPQLPQPIDSQPHHPFALLRTLIQQVQQAIKEGLLHRTSGLYQLFYFGPSAYS